MEWNSTFLPLCIYIWSSKLKLSLKMTGLLSSRLPLLPYTNSQVIKPCLVIIKKSRFRFAIYVLEFRNQLDVLCKNIYALTAFIQLTYLELMVFICYYYEVTFCSCSSKKMYYCVLVQCQNLHHYHWVLCVK